MRCSIKSHLVAFAALVATGALQVPVMAQSSTTIGSTLSHCSSPTVIGSSNCAPPEAKAVAPVQPKPKLASSLVSGQRPAAPPADSASDAVVGGVRESEVNDFLANYGKPSRQAVRALLNPSDENISAMLKVEKSQLAVAAYTAQRRVELTQQAGIAQSELSQADLPALIGMRITVVVSADCRGCEKVLPIVNQLVTEFPSVDARVGVLGMGEPKEFVVKMAELGVYLPVSKISAERVRQLRLEALPSVLVGDTRFPGEPALVGEVSSALDLERAVVRVRRSNEKRNMASGTAGKGDLQ